MVNPIPYIYSVSARNIFFLKIPDLPAFESLPCFPCECYLKKYAVASDNRFWTAKKLSVRHVLSEVVVKNIRFLMG